MRTETTIFNIKPLDSLLPGAIWDPQVNLEKPFNFKPVSKATEIRKTLPEPSEKH